MIEAGIELLQQIQDLAGAGIEALQGALSGGGEGGGAPAEGGAPAPGQPGAGAPPAEEMPPGA